MIEAAAHLELSSRPFTHDLIALEIAADLRDRVDANHGGAMNLPELVRVERIDQFLDRCADQGFEAFGLHARVLVLGAKEEDVAGQDHPDIGADTRLYPA
jgi:hypothetical protein